MTVPRRPRFDQVRERIERQSQVIGQDTSVRGRVMVEGVGEFVETVDFAVVFYEKPYLFPGAVEVSGTAEREHFPAAEMVITGWKMRPASSGPQSHYIGATIAVRVGGKTSQKVWVSYEFRGKALSSVNIS